MIECGIPLQRIREAIGDLSQISACLVSHEHADHADYLPKLERQTNIPIWCSKGTRIRFQLYTHNLLKNKNVIKIGHTAQILPLILTHDVDCYGFLIVEENKKLFYATDTADVKYNIPGLTHLMIEANHSFETMIGSARGKALESRVAQSHLDIDSVVDFVKMHPDLEEIHLIHLSRENSDADLFKQMAIDAAGAPVYVADE